ncbi:DUF4012 domain-containing protein [Frankia sp. AgB32]|uniref:DUF4012 domain-containing protein n=1 Tax=Frankia sp. AgB32 TaxID=631119 RepID=UPI00200CA3F6|nr:DUF4012 domain-containing protein [Frankia sp. AgB32]MCK9897381.1 DUF4012 domain-containing protein [Frankia sp. AgB32]
MTAGGSGDETSAGSGDRRPADPAATGAIPRQAGARAAPDGTQRHAEAHNGAAGTRPAGRPPTGLPRQPGAGRPIRPGTIGAGRAAQDADLVGAPALGEVPAAGPAAVSGTAAAAGDGTPAAPAGETGEGGPRRPQGRRRWLVGGGALVFAVLVGLVGWVAVRGLMARTQLDQARSRIAALQQQALAGHLPPDAELRAQVAAIGERARAARSLTGDPVWSAFGHLPWAGCPLRSAAGLVQAVDTVAGTGLPAVADLGSTLNPSRLRHEMTVDVAALAAARAPAQRATAALDTLRAAAERTPVCGWTGRVSGVDDARAELIHRGTTLSGALDNVALAARIGPDMLGATGRRRYLLVVQNPAESRADGGIIGGYGLLTADRGKLSLDGISGNGSLPGGPTQASSTADLPAPFAARYGSFWPDRVWANANLTPDYPTAGRLYTGLYRAGTGIEVDGTISVDPTTLSYLLAASRPAVLPGGQVVTANNLVDLVESKVYEQVPTVDGRDRFFAQVGQAVYASVVSGAGDTTRLLTGLAKAAREGRLTVSSNHADEQDVLSATALGGALPTGNGPYLAVVTQNAAASKLDYWLRRQTTYRVQRMPGGAGAVTIVIRLTSVAPDHLSDYVRNREDEARPNGNPTGQNNIWLSVYTGRDSLFAGASLDGQPIGLATGSENGLPVVSTYLTVDRGQTRTLEIKVLEPKAGPALAVRPQPLPVPERLDVEGVPVTSPWSRSVRN